MVIGEGGCSHVALDWAFFNACICKFMDSSIELLKGGLIKGVILNTIKPGLF